MLDSLLLILLSVTSDDQAPDTANKPTEEQVIVTASKRQQSAQNLSTAVSVISKEDIENKNITLLPDLLRGEAGVYIQQTTPGQGIPIIRGLKGSENVHLIDGMRLNTAFFRNSPNQYLALVDPFLMDQIEVIRGPASVLYGGDALGGVINIISHTPEFYSDQIESSGKLFISYDSADEKTLSHLTMDAGNDKIATSLGLSYQDVGLREIGGGEEIPFTGYRAKAINNKWLFNINEENKLKFNFQYLNQPETPRVDDLIPGFGQTQPDSSFFVFKPNERQFAHLSWENTTETSAFDRFQIDASWQQIKDHRSKQSFGSDSFSNEQNESALLSIQSAFNKSINDQNDLVYGLDFYDDTISSAKQKVTANGVSSQSESRFPDQSVMRHIGIFADWTHYFEGQDLTIGFRYSDYNIDLNSPTINNDELKLDDLTWHIGWLKHVNDNNKLYSNLGRGFRPPNIFDLGQVGDRPGNRFNIINTNVKPETVFTLDFGWRHFSESWDIDLAVFYSKYNDKIAGVETGQLTESGQIIIQSQNLNNVILYGLESSFSFYPNDKSEFNALINYTWGEEESNAVKEPADRIPPLNGFLSYEYRFDSQWSLNPKIIFSDRQDRLSNRDTRDPRINPNGTGGFTTYNFYAKYQLTDESKIRVGIENIFDKKYREHGSGLNAAGKNLHISYSQEF